MLNRYLNMAFGAVIGHFLKDKIRRGSIKAVKAYIQIVSFLRLGLLGIFGLGVAAAVLVSGIVLVVVGIIGLLPIEATSAAVSILVIGLLFSIGAGIGLIMLFSQKRWLEMSKSYELMDSVLAPWPGHLPPNPIAVVKGQAPTHREEMRPDLTKEEMPAASMAYATPIA